MIRNLSKDEANVFLKAANLAITTNDAAFVFDSQDGSHQWLTFNDISTLGEVGLLQVGQFINYELDELPEDANSSFISGNVVILVTKKADIPLTLISINLFTKAGSELLTLVKTSASMPYLTEFARTMIDEGLTVKYAYLVSVEANGIRHSSPTIEFDLSI